MGVSHGLPQGTVDSCDPWDEVMDLDGGFPSGCLRSWHGHSCVCCCHWPCPKYPERLHKGGGGEEVCEVEGGAAAGGGAGRGGGGGGGRSSGGDPRLPNCHARYPLLA